MMMKPSVVLIPLLFSLAVAQPARGADAPAVLADAEARLAPLLRDPDDPMLRQELRQMLYSGFSVGYLALTQADPQHPDFWPAFNPAYNFFAPNPDDTYYAAPLDPKGTYRITGLRGTTRIVDFQIAGGALLPSGTGTLGKTYANHDLDRDVKLGQDGSFSVIVSSRRPEGYAGDSPPTPFPTPASCGRTASRSGRW